MIPIVVFVLTLLIACRHKECQCFAKNLGKIESSTGREYKSIRNIKVDSDLISEYQTESRISCLAKCFAAQCQTCTALAFNDETSQCRLYESNGKSYSGNAERGWKYYFVDWCPYYDGFKFNRSLGLCYKEVLGTHKYQDSVDLCNTYNAELPRIQNEEEQIFFKELMEQSGISSIFLGAYRDGSNWFWNCGDPFVYANWDTGQPEFGDDCFVLMKSSDNYQWHDYRVNAYSMGTICEYRKISA